MAEMKHNFTSGKMNKDLDERLVPDGEYRHAMNVQVATSEGSDVGTVQNILGNSLGCSMGTSVGKIPIGSQTVGSISDEKNDSLYWLVSGGSGDQQNDPNVWWFAQDMIMRKAEEDRVQQGGMGRCLPVFVDKYEIGLQNTNDDSDTQFVDFADNSGFEHLTTGMVVTGYDTQGVQTFPTQPDETIVISSIGNSDSYSTNFSAQTYDVQTQLDMATNLPGYIPDQFWFGLDCPTSNLWFDHFRMTHFPTWFQGHYWPDKIILSPNVLANQGDTVKIIDENNNLIFQAVIASIGPHIAGNYQNRQVEFNSVDTEALKQVFFPTASSGGVHHQDLIGVGGMNYAGCDAGVGLGVFDVASWDIRINTTIEINSSVIVINDSQFVLDTLNDIINNNTSLDVLPSPIFPLGGCLVASPSSTALPNEFMVANCNALSIGYPPAAQGGTIDLVNGWGSADFDNVITLGSAVDLSNTNYLLFNSERILDFRPDRLITGINIIDDILLWTDGSTEPKKININRSLEGTDISGDFHTKLINHSVGITSLVGVTRIKKDHITVIKKSPKARLQLKQDTDRNPDLNYSAIMQISNDYNAGISSFTDDSELQGRYNFINMEPGDYESDLSVFSTKIFALTDTGLVGDIAFDIHWEVGDKVMIKEFNGGSAPDLPLSDYTIKGHIAPEKDPAGNPNHNFSTIGDLGDPDDAAKVMIVIDAIDGTPPIVSGTNQILRYVIDKYDDDDERLFEFKFPRFSYRYKYEDNEYSTFAPWTNVAFIPGTFNYHPEQGYNLGMANRLKELTLHGFITDDMPKDVVEIDLLYKDDAIPNVYVVDTIKPQDEPDMGSGTLVNHWQQNKYKIDAEMVHGAVASNQLLRPWDNVPKKAAAQDVVGNRVVYGNYTQGYNLSLDDLELAPRFKHALSKNLSLDKRSIKSLREYQLGVVFTDKYGRETPVITNRSGSFKTNKDDAEDQNSLKVGFKGQNVPPDLTHFKFYIKETSGEYYNLAMDRHYDATDGNVWLSFPSSDRNKIDVDTFLILKKGVGSDELVRDAARYKVLAIENEAPEFIKTEKNNIGQVNNSGADPLFASVAESPALGRKGFRVQSIVFESSSLGDVHEITEPLEIDFKDLDTGSVSPRYKVASVSRSAPGEDYFFALDGIFDENIGVIINGPVGSPTSIKSSTELRIYQLKIENSPKFDGKFFVKIFADEIFSQSITSDGFIDEDTEYVTRLAQKVFLLGDDLYEKHSQDLNSNPTSFDFGKWKVFGNDDYWSGYANPSVNYSMPNPGETLVNTMSTSYWNDWSIWDSQDGGASYSGLSGTNAPQHPNPHYDNYGAWNIGGGMDMTANVPFTDEEKRRWWTRSLTNQFPRSINSRTDINIDSSFNVGFPAWDEGGLTLHSQLPLDTAQLGLGVVANPSGPGSLYNDRWANQGCFSRMGNPLFGNYFYLPKDWEEEVTSLQAGQCEDKGHLNSKQYMAWRAYFKYNVSDLWTVQWNSDYKDTADAIETRNWGRPNDSLFSGSLPDIYGTNKRIATYMTEWGSSDIQRNIQHDHSLRGHEDGFEDVIFIDKMSYIGSQTSHDEFVTFSNWWNYSAKAKEDGQGYDQNTGSWSPNRFEDGIKHGIDVNGVDGSQLTIGIGPISPAKSPTDSYLNGWNFKHELQYTYHRHTDGNHDLSGQTPIALPNIRNFGEDHTGYVKLLAQNMVPGCYAMFSPTAQADVPIPNGGCDNTWFGWMGAVGLPTVHGPGLSGTSNHNVAGLVAPKMWDLEENGKYLSKAPFFNSMESGRRFRWSEDPNGTVYQVSGATERRRRIRFMQADDGGVGNPYTQNGIFNFDSHLWDGVETSTSANPKQPNNFENQPGDTPFSNPYYFTSENFTKNSLFNFTPSMQGWDPTVGVGPNNEKIVGTDQISHFSPDNGVTTTVLQGAWASNSVVRIPIVNFNTAYSTAPVGRYQEIQVGMILTKIGSSASTNMTGQESNGDLRFAYLVKSIEFTSSNAEITITGYNTTHTPVNLDDEFNGSQDLSFCWPIMNGLSVNSVKNIEEYAPSMIGYDADLYIGIGAVGYTLEWIDPLERERVLPENPAIFETEPKDNTDLDVYYEISNNNPISLNRETSNTAIPYGSTVTCNHGGQDSVMEAYVEGSNGNEIVLDQILCVDPGGCGSILPVEVGDVFYITRPTGETFGVAVDEVINPNNSTGSRRFLIDPFLYNGHYILPWHNCYSFGNGVESNRIRDNFNLPFILSGAKVSTTLSERYQEEHRSHGLIYSGLYNSISGVNNLNQFIMAEKITKDINPIHGAIQKLHARDTDLVVLCEDKILKILANKDAVFNADGNPQLTATDKVLGQTTPFVGEYGISKNPESFASESYRAYFTDQIRGAVMRLSKDGLTPISDAGMKDWFKENLKTHKKIIGSYDDLKQEYNITLYKDKKPRHTVSYKEDVKGWVSFKSFMVENGVSSANNYFTFQNAVLWKHHHQLFFQKTTIEYNRNTFYRIHTPSSFIAILNQAPGTVKTFKTINYEGSQAKIDGLITYDTYESGTNIIREANISDGEYYNLEDKIGWFVKDIFTNKERGGINEFIEKEGKWFNYIKGRTGVALTGGGANPNFGVSEFGDNSFNSSDSSLQGIGTTGSAPIITSVTGCMDSSTFDFNGPGGVNTYPLNINYNQFALVPGTCVLTVLGCMDPLADAGYNNLANMDTVPTLCFYYGCTDSQAINFDPNANFDDGSCNQVIPGCMDGSTLTNGGVTYNTMFNYDASANVDDGSCVLTSLGCIVPLANNYDPLANTDDGSCCYIAGCMDSAANNFNILACSDNGSCNYTVLGCMDVNAANYDAAATVDDGSCIIYGCTDVIANNYDVTANTDDGSCDYAVLGCMDSNAMNYNANATQDDPNFPCIFPPVYGCMDPLASNFDPLATAQLNAFACTYVLGCTDITMYNYNPLATIDDGSCYVAFYGCMDGAAFNYDDDATVNETSATDPTDPCIPVVNGCTSADASTSGYNGANLAVACNHNPLANVDDGSCNYNMCLGCTDPTYLEFCNTCWDVVNQVAVTNGSGGPWLGGNASNASKCVTQIVYGCMDDTMFNYDPLATVDDGSCVPPPIPQFGCTDPNAFNYDPNANTDNGTCIAVVLGCTDLNAFNYDPLANTDDGSCIAVVLGCTDPLAFNYFAQANTDDGSCIAVVLGCMNQCASNYDPLANTDDGSCIALAIGDTHEGGVIFYLQPNCGGGLVAAVPSQVEYPSGVQWTSSPPLDIYSFTGTLGEAIGTGQQNTIDLVAAGGNTAAEVCASLTFGGYSDWFLPSRYELLELSNNIGLKTLGYFPSPYATGYWSSTEDSTNYFTGGDGPGNVFIQIMGYYGNGIEGLYGKSNTQGGVIAVRAF